MKSLRLLLSYSSALFLGLRVLSLLLVSGEKEGGEGTLASFPLCIGGNAHDFYSNSVGKNKSHDHTYMQGMLR